MNSSTTIAGVALVLVISITTTQCLQPSLQDDQHRLTDEQTDRNKDGMRTTAFRSFDAVTRFIRSWFEKIRTRALNRRRIQVIHNRKRRDDTGSYVQLEINNNSTDEAAFEQYEKEYLIQQTMNDLKTLYYHNQYFNYLKDKKTDDRSHRKPSKDYTGTAAPPSARPNPSTNGPDFNRVDPILEEKLHELRNLSVRDLNRIFRDVRRAVEDGGTDNSIASLCCQMTG